MIGSSNIHQIFPTISLCGHDSNVLPHLLLRLGMTILLAVENEIWMELIHVPSRKKLHELHYDSLCSFSILRCFWKYKDRLPLA